jgi:predicted DNA-binding transcriptional regulator YafY
MASAMLETAPNPSHDSVSSSRATRLISRVMQQTDDLVVVIDYQGKDGTVTRRVVSPIRFVGTDRFLALCLSREEPRQFYLDRCSNVRVDLAGNYIMPVELQIVA